MTKRGKLTMAKGCELIIPTKGHCTVVARLEIAVEYSALLFRKDVSGKITKIMEILIPKKSAH